MDRILTDFSRFMRKLSGFPLALLLVHSAAFAQQGNVRMPQFPRPAAIPENLSPFDQGRATLAAFAHCVLLRSRHGVERALALPAGTASDEAIRRLASEECIEGNLQTPVSLMRGALYKALYISEFSHDPAPATLEPFDFSPDAKDMSGPSALPFIALRQFIDCTIRLDPAPARLLVLAPIGSLQEKSAFAALAPQASKCINEGQKISFTREALSGLIAEVLYRQSHRLRSTGADASTPH